MKTFHILTCVFGACLVAGCYSVEQSNVERGYRWVRRGETDKAIATFTATTRQYPDSVLAYAGLADALFEAKRDREAIDAYDRALAALEKARPESTRRGEVEIVGSRFGSYQNQGLRFPFGLEPYLHLRRGGAYHALAKAPGSDPKNFRSAAADYDRALTLAPGYAAAKEERERLRREAPQLNPPPAPSR